MDIRIVDHIVYADYSHAQVNNTIVSQISSHTAETWQPNRMTVERGRNIQQGKIAEEIVESLVGKYFRTSISMKAYDEIRNDNYEKHAPFDFLLWEAGKVDILPIEMSIRNDIASTQNQFVKLSEYTRRLCKDLNVKIAEVKSTKIREDLKKRASFKNDYEDEEAIRRLVNIIKCTDDVFCYPHYKRSEINQEYSIADYCRYVKSLEPSLVNYEGEELRRKVIDMEAEKQCCDVFIRVYLDTSADKGIVIGWMQRERLLDYAVHLKRMYQFGKSERALYFAKNLQETESIERIPEIFCREEHIYASPFTTTNFYHRDKNCKYLRGVNQVDLIMFQNEEEAIENGRYTNRCKNCFE